MGKKMNRRQFIKNSSATLGSMCLLGSSLSLVSCTQQSYKKAVVIGSGFGGAVAALRLGEAGISTALIERGRDWTYEGPNTYPTIEDAEEGDGRTTWLGEVDGPTGTHKVEYYPGMMERIEGDTLPTVVPAGLGGGSLVYGGVLLQPKKELFEKVFPSLDYDEMDKVYYPRVLSYVSGGTIPDDILNHPSYSSIKSIIENAEAAKFDVIKSHVGFNWNTIRKELNGELPEAASVGEYVYSCNSNAKNTLDKNYIQKAKETGLVEINVLHNVVDITENSVGGYIVTCEVLDLEGQVMFLHEITCDYLFMAAGSPNTAKLLLKAKYEGTLPNVNDNVGKSFAGNGDELVARLVYNPSQQKIQGGPPAVAIHDPSNPIKPVSFMHSPTNIHEGLPDGVTLQQHMSMSIPDELGSIGYDPQTGKAVIKFPYDGNARDREAHEISMQKLPHIRYLSGAEIGSANGIWHPLGGTVMGEACTELGELIGQKNLFVVDGSLMPGSTAAANPALTIAANAERMMEKLIPKLRGY